jgi:hypothetical protein
VRIQTGIFLDMAGWIDDAKLKSQLREALSYSDPRLVAFAALSLLPLGEHVSKEILEIPAASHECRNLLYERLKELKCEKKFPKKWKSWDAFAASSMVEWLRMPNEFGREPDELEKMAVLTEGSGKKQLSLYVWRFKNDKDKHSFAGISGVYQLTGEPAPIRGSETFSRFDRWDSEDAVGHANLCLGTLKEWRTAWANETPKKSPVKKRK